VCQRKKAITSRSGHSPADSVFTLSGAVTVLATVLSLKFFSLYGVLSKPMQMSTSIESRYAGFVKYILEVSHHGHVCNCHCIQVLRTKSRVTDFIDSLQTES